MVDAALYAAAQDPDGPLIEFANERVLAAAADLAKTLKGTTSVTSKTGKRSRRKRCSRCNQLLRVQENGSVELHLTPPSPSGKPGQLCADSVEEVVDNSVLE